MWQTHNWHHTPESTVKSFSSEIGNKTRLHTLTTTIQLTTGRMSFRCNADDFEDIHVLIKLTVLNYLYLPKIIPEKNCQVSFYISERFNNNYISTFFSLSQKIEVFYKLLLAISSRGRKILHIYITFVQNIQTDANKDLIT